MQEPALLHPDVDERRLHAGKDGGDETCVDVPNVALFLFAIDEQLAELIVFEDGDARFLGVDVDEDLALHESLEEGQCWACVVGARGRVPLPGGAPPQPST